ncbi:MAG: beta-propeller fold lactonase family protein [Terriglobales bacterium]
MRAKFRILLLLLLVLVALAVLSGCSSCPSSSSGNGTGSSPGGGSVTGSSTCGSTGGGGGGGTVTTTALLYYFGPSDIQGASLNSLATFANLSPFTPPALPTSGINSMVIVNKQFLYVPIGGLAEVEAFSINHASGALTAISGSPFPAQASDDTLTSDPKGRFLFVGGRFTSSISAYQIDPTTGSLNAAPGSPVQSFNVAFANSLTVDGNGKFLYVGQTFSSLPVAVFSIDKTTGALTEITGSPFQLGVSVVQADPSGKFLLGVADNTGASGDPHIYVFSIDPITGAPTPVPNSPFATVSIPFALTIHPNGNFVYPSVADNTDTVTSLEGYGLDTTSGALTALSGSPFTALPIVANCLFDQSGVDAFCLNATGFSVLTANTGTGALSHSVLDLAAASNFPFAPTN